MGLAMSHLIGFETVCFNLQRMKIKNNKIRKFFKNMFDKKCVAYRTFCWTHQSIPVSSASFLTALNSYSMLQNNYVVTILTLSRNKRS